MSSLPSNGRRRTPRAAAAGMALALGAGLLGGCGGSAKTPSTTPAGAGNGKPVRSTTTAAPEPQKPACGLITQAEVESALGAKVTPGRESAQPDRSVCSFALASGPDQTVIVTSRTSSDAPAALAGDRERAGTSAGTVTAGDQAFVAGGQGAVLKGRTYVTVLVAVRQSPAAVAAVATKLLQDLAARL